MKVGKTNSQAIHLYNVGDYVYVAVEVDGEWVPVIKEYAPTREVALSHIVEPDAASIAAPRLL